MFFVIQASQDFNKYLLEAMDEDQDNNIWVMIQSPEIVSLTNFNVRDSDGDTPLMWAIRFYHEDLALALLDLKDDQGVSILDLSVEDDLGSNALMLAIQCDFPDVFMKILSLRRLDGSLVVDINFKNYLDKTALRWAIEKRDRFMFKQLLLHGADATIADTINYLKRLFQAPVIKYFLSILDALKPGIIKPGATLKEQIVLEAYEEFLHGNHQKLKNLFLEINLFPIKDALEHVFKEESLAALAAFFN